MIREKGARLESPSRPLITGFVEIPEPGGMFRVTGRVQNVSELTMGVYATWNVAWAKDPRAVKRIRSFNGRKIAPGEALEDDHDLARNHFYINGERVADSDRWFDVTWSVHYRDRHGLFQTIDHFMRVAD